MFSLKLSLLCRLALFLSIVGSSNFALSKTAYSTFITASDEQSTFEISGFESYSHRQTDKAFNGIKEEIEIFLEDKRDQKIEIQVLLEGDGENHSPSDLAALKFAQQLKSLNHEISIEQENLIFDPAIEKTFQIKKWKEQGYRLAFALIRGAASGGAIATTLIVSAAAPLEAIIPIALISGFMSTSFQYYIDAFQNWAENTGPLAKLFGYADTSEAPKLIHRSESFLRWYLAQIIFSGVLKASMATAGMTGDFDSFRAMMAAAGHIALSSVYATWAQGTWDRAITAMKQNAEAEKILTKNQISFRSNANYLAAGISATIILALDFMGFKGAQVGFFAMGGIGMISYLKAIGHQRFKSAEPTKMNKATASSCRVILKAIKI